MGSQDFAGIETLSVKERRAGKVSEVTKLKRRVHKALIDNMDLKKMDLETKDDPNKITRKWFAWANTIFGELILKSYKERPHVLS